MKKLHFEYRMRIEYSVEVSKCNFTIKCIPKTNVRQRIGELDISVSPPTRYHEGKDGLNNKQIYGSNDYPHNYFEFVISGEAITGISTYDEEYDDNIDMLFKHPYGLNVAGPKLMDYCRYINPFKISDGLERAEYIMSRLHSDFKYVKNSTSLNTSAEEAFAQGYGVCQDYAHIFISLLHLANIPARYVTGLIIGEGESHAWVEVLYKDKWYGLDPTNDTLVRDNHIKIGIGRDARDCTINRGIMHGGGLHTQTINVCVKEETFK